MLARGHGRPALEAEQRCEIDDLAFTALQHWPAELLAELEHRTQIDVHHLVEGFKGEVHRRVAVLGAGVVHQDVHPAGGQHPRRRRGDGLGVGKVESHELQPSPQGRRAGGQLGRNLAAGEHDDIGARLQQRRRDAQAQTATTAGDDGGLAGEVEGAAHWSARPVSGVSRTLRQSWPEVAASNAAATFDRSKALVGKLPRPRASVAISSIARVTSAEV